MALNLDKMSDQEFEDYVAKFGTEKRERVRKEREDLLAKKGKNEKDDDDDEEIE